MNTPVQFVVIAMMGLLSVGCATKQMYRGPKRDKEDISVVKPVARKVGSYLGFSEKEIARIISVDGKKVGNEVVGYPRHIDLLPGHHSLVAQYFTSKFKKVSVATGGGMIPALIDRKMNEGIILPERSLFFEVFPGQSYVLKTSTANGMGHDLKMWIANTDTGEIISSMSGDRSLSVLEKLARKKRAEKSSVESNPEPESTF